MLVDSHCHIDIMGDKTLECAEGFIANAKEVGVEYLQCVSINLNDLPNIINIAEKFDNVFASVGVHPNDDKGNKYSVEQLLEFAVNDRVISIGETGLDYFRSKGDLDWQRERFITHLDAAREIKKPVVIHIRDAFDDAYEIMKEQNIGDIGGVVHCFTENYEAAQKVIDLGMHIGISGIVTFNSAKDIKEVAQKIPLESLLIETDSPFLAPVPNRGKRNEPAYVKYVAKQIAELRDDSFENIANATSRNFFRCFNLDFPG